MRVSGTGQPPHGVASNRRSRPSKGRSRTPLQSSSRCSAHPACGRRLHPRPVSVVTHAQAPSPPSGDGQTIECGQDHGLDTIVGGAGDDLLIGSATSYGANLTALDAILSEWASADLYATRITKLRAGTIPGGYKLDATTVVNDNLIDVLTGGLDQDWFITHTSTPDNVTDKDGSETRTVL